MTWNSAREHNKAVLNSLPKSGDKPKVSLGLGLTGTVVDQELKPGDLKPTPMMYIAKIISIQGRTIRVRAENDKAHVVWPCKFFFNADQAMEKYKELGGKDGS